MEKIALTVQSVTSLICTRNSTKPKQYSQLMGPYGTSENIMDWYYILYYSMKKIYAYRVFY